MDPVSALKTSAAAVSLVAALARLINQHKPGSGTESPNLPQLLARLQPEAVCISRDLENRLRILVERMESDYGLNPSLTLENQLRNLNWYNFLTRARFKSFREECSSIYRRLTEFIDDVTAILICNNNPNGASVSFTTSLQKKRELDQIFLNSNLSVGEAA
jgi:hypothetical protein